jgi:hypothetical protein
MPGPMRWYGGMKSYWKKNKGMGLRKEGDDGG